MKQQEGGRGDLPPPLQHRRRGEGGALPPPLEHCRRGEGGPVCSPGWYRSHRENHDFCKCSRCAITGEKST